ncbi:MAG TPA: hypothetical protein VKQ36_12435 [Ktedonobacterales bacterium]|nr:hypothetical protein [Ktedonobacterales bacterium]
MLQVGAYAVLGIIWLFCSIATLTKAGAFCGRPQIQRAMERVMGVVLVALGLRLLTEQR